MRDVMLAYFNGGRATPFQPPAGVTRAQVCFPGGTLVSSSGRNDRDCKVTEDWFVASRLPQATPQATPRPGDDRSTPGASPSPKPTQTPRSNRGPGSNNSGDD
jgi:hypothetical protein